MVFMNLFARSVVAKLGKVHGFYVMGALTEFVFTTEIVGGHFSLIVASLGGSENDNYR
jgi:hypothetical protein